MRNYIRLIGILTIINICSSAWYSDWLYRKSITNNSAAGGDLTNFPLLLVISNDNDLSNHASSNGYDILFTLKNGTTKLAHEIEYYASGTLIAWIKIPVLSATEQDSNVIYMYYGKSGAENQQNSNNVYDSDYYMVHHLSETAGTHYDSTVNARNGTWNFVSGTSTMNTNGKIGGADYFDGSGDYIKLPLVTNTNITVETWVYRLSKDAVTADVGLGSWRYSPTMSSNDGFEHARFHINSDQCRFQVVTSNTSTSVKTNNIAGYTFSDSTLKWIYVAGTYDSVSGKVRLWIDGTNAATQSAGAGDVMTLFSGNTYMRIGSSTVNTGDFHGFVDEVKLSVIARSSNWILNSYSNQVNPTTFRLPPGSVENFPGVIYTSISPLTSPCLANENTIFVINALVYTGAITSVNINWGDGQNSSFAPGTANISAKNFSHEYTSRNNFTVTAVVIASSGMAATNSTVISTLPYRFYNPYNIGFSLEPKGCQVNWNIVSSANITHFNLYRGSDLHARIENPSLRGYLDERVIFGDSHSYWLEAVYAAGSIFSATNISSPHSVYKREAVLGTGGGSLDTLIAGLNIPPNSLSASCTLAMNILSNRYTSFYESGKPVYQQIEISGSEINGKIKGSLALKFRIPVTNGILVFKPDDTAGYTATAHKDKLFCAIWDGKTWTPLSTAVYENRLQNNFNFLELETSVNKLGIYGILYNPLGASYDDPVTIKNRIFVPWLNDPNRSSVQISFPNPQREQVKILVFDKNGKIIKEDDFYEWISFWSWNGLDRRGKLADSGLYIISIAVGGKYTKANKMHVYLLK